MPAPNSPPDDLHDLLHTWEVQPRTDPALARQVWARIAAEERPGGLAGWFGAWRWPRTITALVAAVVFAAGGAWAAQLQGSNEHQQRVARLAAEYAQSIDPILMTHPAEHARHAP